MPTYGTIVKVSDRFREQILRRERKASAEMVRVYGSAWQRIKREVDDFNKQYAERVAKGQNVSEWKLRRLKDLQTQVERDIAQFAAYSDTKIRSEQYSAIELAQVHAEYMTRTMLGKPPSGVTVNWNRVPREALENLIGTLQDGSPLRDLLNALPKDAGKQVADTLTEGLTLGQSPIQIARQMRKALGGNMIRALKISRTEVLRSYRESSRRGYQENSNVVSGWIRLSAASDRTCAACFAEHGSFHTLDETLDDHPNGRCMSVPAVRSWEALGYPGIKDTRPEIPSGASMFEKLSEAEKQSVLGPAKYAGYQAGVLNINDLSGHTFDEKWGGSVYEKSLTELGYDSKDVAIWVGEEESS